MKLVSKIIHDNFWYYNLYANIFGFFFMNKKTQQEPDSWFSARMISLVVGFCTLFNTPNDRLLGVRKKYNKWIILPPLLTRKISHWIHKDAGCSLKARGLTVMGKSPTSPTPSSLSGRGETLDSIISDEPRASADGVAKKRIPITLIGCIVIWVTIISVTERLSDKKNLQRKKIRKRFSDTVN